MQQQSIKRLRNFGVLAVIVAVISVGIGFFIYSVFIIPEYIYIKLLWDGNEIKTVTEPLNLLQRQHRISRFTDVLLAFENQSSTVCEVTTQQNGKIVHFTIAKNEPSGSFFLQKGKINTVQFCGQTQQLDLRNL